MIVVLLLLLLLLLVVVVVVVVVVVAAVVIVVEVVVATAAKVVVVVVAVVVVHISKTNLFSTRPNFSTVTILNYKYCHSKILTFTFQNRSYRAVSENYLTTRVFSPSPPAEDVVAAAPH